ncbi:kinase-like domain-containing protein [Rhizophagus irregularis DAOM 181602=DAOM 197198]|nr:kinase-like domain-containing protein [Rhizophagus irregularis DAOM 181602=DAOM 197198]
MYKEGKYVKKNNDKAFELFNKTAKGEDLNGINMLGYWNNTAQYNLALMYKEGKYVDKNNDKAFELFKKSAEGEDLNGIYMLGYCYENGIGTDIDQ